MFPFISVLIGISLVYYIRQRKAEKEMDEIVSSLPQPSDNSLLLVLETCALSCSSSLIVKFV